MTLQPVLIAIPDDSHLCPSKRRQRQREYARMALRECAVLSGAPLEGYRQDDQDVPLPNEGFSWSVSHKRRWAAAVVSDRPVGIDIECLTPRRDGLFDMVGVEQEWRILGGRTWENFYRLFTAKEATLKANGLGIGCLLECRLVEALPDGGTTLEHQDRRWPIEYSPCPEHLAAVCGNGHPIQWRVAGSVE